MRVYLKSYSSEKCLSGSEESSSQYFYHSDHLGSAQLVTNQDGEVYQRIEYTPYGETWIDMRTNITALYDVSYRFTAKELDSETGLYYYGARYLDPKYSRWLSTDPALGEYVPAAGKGNASDIGNLPGMGGIYNSVNGNLYHYAGNNPVKYVDPDGRFLSIYYLNQYFNKRVKEIADENSNEAQSQMPQFFQGYSIKIKTDAMRKVLEEDGENGLSLLGKNIDFYLPQLGLDNNEQKSSDYTAYEKSLYKRLQKLRNSKDMYGDYRTYLVDKIINKALKVQKETYNSNINEDESNKKEALLKSDLEANKVIDEELTKLGY